MKLTSIILGTIFSFSTLAAEIPSDARNIRLSHVTVGDHPTKVKEVECGAGWDISCYEVLETKKVVEVSVDYITNGSSEDESFKQRFDAAEFTDEQLSRLQSRNFKKRMSALREIFGIEVNTERRTGTYEACGFEEGCTPEELAHWTYSYDHEVKVVNVIKK